MAKLLDQIIVVDVESTCWKGPPPDGQQSDIIEVGVTLLDVATLQRSEKRSLLVKPTRSEVSAFCTELTSITPEDVADAGTLADACRVLRKAFRAKDRTWASFGDYDRRQFERCCEALDVGYPFGPTHMNVKSVFALTRGLTREPSLMEALRELGLAFEGTHHRGHDDAWNIAAVLAEVLRPGR